MIIQKLSAIPRKLGWSVQARLIRILYALAGRGSTRWVDRALVQFLFNVRSVLLFWLDDRPGKAQTWMGKEKNSGHPLKVAYVADESGYTSRTHEYLQQLLFAPDDIEIRDLDHFPAGNIHAVARSLGGAADLVIVDGYEIVRWQPGRGKWRLSPYSYRMVRHYPPGISWEEVEKGMYLNKRKIKTAQKNGFTCAASDAQDDFVLFYERMYVPMMQERHAGYGTIQPIEAMRGEFQRGLLMLVRDASGQAVAGGLYQTAHGYVTMLANGMLDGNMEWYDKGANAAMYYYSMQWFHQRGYNVFDAGCCRPFTTDGLYEYKRRWGLSPVKDLWNPRTLLFWTPTDSLAAHAWLEHHAEIQPVSLNWNGGMG